MTGDVYFKAADASGGVFGLSQVRGHGHGDGGSGGMDAMTPELTCMHIHKQMYRIDDSTQRRRRGRRRRRLYGPIMEVEHD